MKKIILSSLLFFISFVSLFAQSSIRNTLDKMYQSIASVRNMTYDMTSQERIGTKMVTKNMSFRIYVNPRKVYMKDKDSGIELLYVQGWNNNNAYIKPNGFPWVNVSFGINNSRVRADGHHPVTHAGFPYIATLMKGTEKMIAQKGYKIEDYIKVAGDYTWNGKNCIKIVCDDPEFRYENHTCTQSESLLAMCERMNLNEYMVMEKNNLGYSSNVSRGQVLKIPRAYAKKVELFLDKTNYIPIVQYVYDEKGLFEKFEFKNVKINPGTETNEWTTQCASYGFK